MWWWLPAVMVGGLGFELLLGGRVKVRPSPPPYPLPPRNRVIVVQYLEKLVALIWLGVVLMTEWGADVFFPTFAHLSWEWWGGAMFVLILVPLSLIMRPVTG